MMVSASNIDRIAMGARLRALRLAMEGPPSMADIAERVGLRGQQAIWRYESGKYVPTGEHLVKLAVLYGVSADFILHGRDEASESTLAIDMAAALAEFAASDDPVASLLAERHWDRLARARLCARPSRETLTRSRSYGSRPTSFFLATTRPRFA